MHGKRCFLRSFFYGWIVFFSTATVVYAQTERFVNIAETAGVANGGKSNGVAFGDFNNDGFEDIFVTRSRGDAK